MWSTACSQELALAKDSCLLGWVHPLLDEVGGEESKARPVVKNPIQRETSGFNIFAF